MAVRVFLLASVLVTATLAAPLALVATAHADTPDEAVTLPPRPVAPKALAPKIARAKTLVANLFKKCVDGDAIDFRNGHERALSPQCPAWRQKLATLGDAIAYAALPAILAHGEEEATADLSSALIDLMGQKSESSAAVLLLLHFKRDGEASDVGALPSPDVALWQLTRADFAAPRPPAFGAGPGAPTLADWAAWWAAHKDQAPATWREAARAKHRGDVRAADPWTRFLAVGDLLASPSDRDAAFDSLHEVLVAGPANVWTPAIQDAFGVAVRAALGDVPEAARKDFLAGAKAHHLPLAVLAEGLTAAERTTYAEH